MMSRYQKQLLNNNPVLKRLSYELSKKEFDVLLLCINYSLTTNQIGKILNVDETEVVK